MAKIKPQFTIESYGIYETFSNTGKSLPRIKEYRTLIPAELDIEFGLILRVKKAKGITINWGINHPNISDKKGNTMAPFEGSEIVRNNDWTFYLGDTIWLPLDDKVGVWHMYFEHNNMVIAEKTFDISLDNNSDDNERRFWKTRGF